MGKPALDKGKGLIWPPLMRGVLIKRYKRFLADVKLDDGPEITAHCPNSGSMMACSEPGRPVYVSFDDNPKRKLKYTWQLIEMPTSLVGVNTIVPNRLVYQAVSHGQVPELAGYNEVSAEVKINTHTRLDVKLSGPDLPPCYVEVKNCTLVERGLARFPDATTLRGQKHLKELIALKRAGARAVMFFVVQRADAKQFAPADSIDPAYGKLLRQAAAAGVEVLVYDVKLDLTQITLNKKLACPAIEAG